MKENVWDNRFKYIDELNRMGANVNVEGKDVAVVEGGSRLTGAPVCANGPESRRSYGNRRIDSRRSY